ncbi:MAG TPA: hypothetical protein VFT34_06115 [Verrucomicrobiae bacterium]|nr:hypothetical protein [Verrucomicrobiae bacterium]
MKSNCLILTLALAATALNAHRAAAQAPAAPPAAAVPDAATIAREKAAADALRAAVAAAAATNPPGRTLPRPINPSATTATPTTPTDPAAAPATPPGPGAPRPAPPAFPTLPVPGTPAATGANTNRPGGIQFAPRAPGVPAAPAPGPGAIAPGGAAGGAAAAAGAPTNTTLGQLRAAAGTNAAGVAAEEVFPPGLIKFQDADLNQVLDIYQELTGRTLLKSGTLPQAKITVKSQTPLTRSEAINALDTILAMNQIATTFQGTKFIKIVQAVQAPQEAEQFNALPWELLPEAAKIVTHIVQLKNALPNEVQQIIQPFAKLPQSIITVPSTSMLVLRDYAENVKRMLEMIEKVDVVPVQEFIDVVIPIKYALVTDIANAIGQLTAGGGVAGSIGQQQSRTGLSTGGGFGTGRGGIGAGGFGASGYPGQPGYNPLNPQATPGGIGSTLGAGGAGGRGSFAQRLNQIVNRAAGGAAGDIYVLGQTKIIPDERTNSLLIFASRQDLVTISNIIEKLDVVLAQVVIEAAVIEVNLNNNLDFGFNYIQTQPTTVGDVFSGGGAIRTIPFLNLGNIFGGGGSNSIGDGFSYAAKFMNFDAAVTAIAGDGRGKILQRPRIQTSHAVEANLFVGQSRPYPSSYSGGGGLYGAYNQIQQLQIGVTLTVLPLVNYDGMVVMDIRQKVESYDGDVDIANVGKVPITSQKEANAKVAVRDRETVMLGGFISNQKNKTHGGVPILKDIPGLGFFFRSTKETEDRRELIVLIRPTVLPTPDQAAAFAKQERARLPGTKEAEYDFNESERKLLEETNKRIEKKSNLYKREGFTR